MTLQIDDNKMAIARRITVAVQELASEKLKLEQQFKGLGNAGAMQVACLVHVLAIKQVLSYPGLTDAGQRELRGMIAAMLLS